MLPPADVAIVRRYCEERVAPRLRDELRVELVEERGSLTIVERRPPWSDGLNAGWTTFPVARMRYVMRDRLWTLFYRDRNERWRRYEDIDPSGDIQSLVAEVERDPTGLFWG